MPSLGGLKDLDNALADMSRISIGKGDIATESPLRN